MSKTEEIKKPIKSELNQFEPYFKNSLKADIPLLNSILNFIYRRKGKQMRPMFVFLAAKIAGDITDKTFHAALTIELLHTATLIHDDVVDESYQRRGFFSLNAIWKNKISVLLGDYILAKGLLLSVEKKEYQFLEIISEAVKEMSEGEILQIEKARKQNITEEDYFEIIRKKTASLIAASTCAGAASATSDPEKTLLLKEFGNFAGITFQIKDDLFDYQKKNNVGKPTANDIQEKKITLPLIHALKTAPAKESEKIRKLLRKKHKNNSQLKTIISFVENYGGIEYAQMKMKEYHDKAITILDNFPESEAKNSMKLLVDYITTREK